ncbi:MAG: ATP-binding cassette domain-containing protein [Bacilli bacterium]|nr:ATP-binding cassette domain-containing protein [Bacilli bacterium]
MEVIFRNVSFSYNKGLENEKQALKNINLCLDSNLIHGIIGPVGSGKSTMLELMNGITKPTSGEVVIGEYELTKNNFDFNKFRYDVGLVYQFPEKQFFCSSVGEEIAFSEKVFEPKNKDVKSKVIKVLKMVGLDESYLNRSPFSLNGGEKRRVAIASVLISNPKLLVLDEPTIGLDNNSKKRLMKLLRGLRTKYSKTIVIVTHDVDMLYEIVDNVVVLNKGEIVKEGSKLEVFSNVSLLDENNTPVPNVIRVEKLIYDKTGIDLGYVSGINELVRAVANHAR